MVYQRLRVHSWRTTYFLEVYGIVPVALSTIDSKYMLVAEASKEALWLARMVKELRIQ